MRTSLPPTPILSIVTFRLITDLCTLLMTKGVITNTELAAIYRGTLRGVEPAHDPGVTQARALMNDLADGLTSH